MIRSPRLWAGVAVGAALAYWWRQRAASPLAFTGGVLTTPKPIRRRGRRLQGGS